MDLTGLVYSIISATANIDSGRKGFATRGKAEEGRISYELGIANALAAFKEAQATTDPQIMILAEYTFLTQELQFCEKTDKDSLNSLTQAIQYFDDAFLVLKTVEDSTLYKAVETAIPHNKKFRVSGYPKDSFHVACGSHITRIKNMLRTPRQILARRLSRVDQPNQHAVAQVKFTVCQKWRSCLSKSSRRYRPHRKIPAQATISQSPLSPKRLS